MQLHGCRRVRGRAHKNVQSHIIVRPKMCSFPFYRAPDPHAAALQGPRLVLREVALPSRYWNGYCYGLSGNASSSRALG